MKFNAKTRKAIYAASAPITAILVVVGVEQNAAAVYVGGAIACLNIVMAFLNVPDSEDDNG